MARGDADNMASAGVFVPELMERWVRTGQVTVTDKPEEPPQYVADWIPCQRCAQTGLALDPGLIVSKARCKICNGRGWIGTVRFL